MDTIVDGIEGQRIEARTSDGARLALLRLPRSGSARVPVLLTHGTFSNGRICAHLAAYLHERGFDCWIVEWRGHGDSDRGPVEPDYERHALYDVEAAVRTALEHTGAPRVCWVGHSAGGVLPWMRLARHPEESSRFSGIVSLASQTTHAGGTLLGKAALGVGFALTNLIGRAPARAFRMGPNDETRGVMNQWFRWNLRRRWTGSDGFDYAAALRAVTTPGLFLAGGGDRFVAPLEGCRLLYDSLGSTDKELVRCSKSEGFREDYSHQRLIASRSANAEIWPLVADWLARRAQPAEVS